MQATGTPLSADDVIRILGLQPHPEGGHYRETFRDDRGDGRRAASTAIYFLLAAGEVSRWHRVDAAEVWHWYAGAPLALSMAPPTAARSRSISAPISPPASGRRPSCRPAYWQSAESLGAWTLVGCTVAPGFDVRRISSWRAEGFAPPRR